MKHFLIVLTTALVIMLSPLTQAQSPLQEIQQCWAKANYQLQGDAQVKAFAALIDTIEQQLEQDPADADLWIWNGIVNSTMAGAKGGLGALSHAKAARAHLEKALQLNDQALAGSAYTSLGTLYHKVPGWPLGFGSDKKARQMLETALRINPEGIDPNYFYGEFLYDEGEYAEAYNYLQAAHAAAPRPDRPLADQGRREEVATMLRKVRHKLEH